jgi:PhzF family phenazine biosynthesis protein
VPTLKYFIVDAFAEHVFLGNQAGVCLVDQPVDDKTMQNIATENNLSETAFILPKGDVGNEFDLRWFTPQTEIDLCGHATLASAYIVSRFVNTDISVMHFYTASGLLVVTKKGDLFEMDFPARKPIKIEITPLMEEAIGCEVLEAHGARDLLLIVKDENTVLSANPDIELLRQISEFFAIIISAKGNTVDFVSRVFAPNAGISEDPVTGSTHSTLIPFWSERLHKKEMIAKQLSKRGGTLYCEDCGERIKISGKAVLYLSGEINY